MSHAGYRPRYLNEEKNRKPKKKANPILRIVLLTVLALLVGGGFLVWKFVIRNIAPEITVEVGQSVSVEDFILRDMGMTAEFASDPSAVNLSVPGDYEVTIRYCWVPQKSVIHVRDTVAPTGAVQHLTVFSTQMPEAMDFVTGVNDLTEVTASFATQPDAAYEGIQSVEILLTDMGGNTAQYTATLTVLHDTTAPELAGVEDKSLYLGQKVDLMDGITVTDDLDAEPTVTVDDSALDLNKEGTYTVTYTARDAGLNETTASATVTVVKDEQAPELLGVRPLSIYVGSPVSYRSNVIVSDDLDSAPTLSVDSSQVDLSTPGTYTVVYTAADGAGNETSMETTITVTEKTADFAEEEEIYKLADAVLAKITNDKMSTKGKVQAIYKWVLNECWYESGMDKTDWMQAAYQMLHKGCGDCFGFYAVCRLLFDRLGLPNLTVQRLENEYRTSTHYWNMVSIDGGETFYHFDSCPHPKPSSNMCLVTDAKLEWFNGHCPYYYYYDTSLYPATPEE